MIADRLKLKSVSQEDSYWTGYTTSKQGELMQQIT